MLTRALFIGSDYWTNPVRLGSQLLRSSFRVAPKRSRIGAHGGRRLDTSVLEHRLRLGPFAVDRDHIVIVYGDDDTLQL